MRTYNSPLTEVSMMEAAMSMMNVSGGVVGGARIQGTQVDMQSLSGGSWENGR